MYTDVSLNRPSHKGCRNVKGTQASLKPEFESEKVPKRYPEDIPRRLPRKYNGKRGWNSSGRRTDGYLLHTLGPSKAEANIEQAKSKATERLSTETNEISAPLFLSGISYVMK